MSEPKLSYWAFVGGVTGGAVFLVMAWFMIALLYALFALLAFIFADGFHAVALLFVSPSEASFLWWFAVVVLMIGTTYGASTALDFIGDAGKAGTIPRTPMPAQGAARAAYMARTRAGQPDPQTPPKTRPSAEEIERRGRATR